MQPHQYFSHKQSYFCPACKNKSLMANGSLKNNKAEGWRACMCVSVSPDMWAADPGHVSTVSSLHLIPPPPPSPTTPPCPPSSNHFCNSDLTLWAVRSMPLIKRKLVFIFKPHHQLRLISRPSLGSTMISCWNCFFFLLLFFFVQPSSFFKAIYWKCNGFHIVVWFIKNVRPDSRLQWRGSFGAINNTIIPTAPNKMRSQNKGLFGGRFTLKPLTCIKTWNECRV